MSKLFRLFKGSFFASSSIIFVGSFVVNVLNYVFTLIMSRYLGVAAFGEVTAMFSLLLVVSVPASAITMLMTRQTAYHTAAGDYSLYAMFMSLRRHLFLASGALWLIFLLLTPLISRFLQIPYTPIFIFSCIIPLTLLSSLQSGTLQGLQEFFMLSKQNILNAMVKLLASLALVYAGLSVAGVMLGLLLAQLAGWGYGYLATHKLLVPREEVSAEPFSLMSMRRLFTTIVVTTLLLVLLSNIDVLLAKHFLPADVAGEYGALSTLGKILVYGIGAFITVLLPMVSAAHAREQGTGGGTRASLTILAGTLGVIVAASVCVYALFALWAPLIVRLLFGAHYLGVAPYLATFSLAMAAISLATACINYFVAVENTSFLYFLAAGICFEVWLIYTNHAGLAAMTHSLEVASAVLLALMLSNGMVMHYSRRRHGYNT